MFLTVQHVRKIKYVCIRCVPLGSKCTKILFPRVRVSGVPIFSCKGQSSRSRSLDVKNVKKLPHIWRTYLLTGGSSACGSGADCICGTLCVNVAIVFSRTVTAVCVLFIYHCCVATALRLFVLIIFYWFYTKKHN